MTKKQIKDLALQSYTANNLDSKKVNKVVRVLKKKELRQYIKSLKNLEKERMIKVILPDLKMNQDELTRQFKKVFPNKRIVYEIDPTLIVGLKIIDNDLVYNLNLRDTLKQINSYIIERYD
ncbi:hypothetical protein M1307_03795 [Patescibacteria group bacterium]|nr:hypothetical protein [Patescibacteria group bacterium]